MHVLTYFFFCKRHYVLAYFYSYIYDRWGLHMITSLSISLTSDFISITVPNHGSFCNIQASRIWHRLHRWSRPFKLCPTNLWPSKSVRNWNFGWIHPSHRSPGTPWTQSSRHNPAVFSCMRFLWLLPGNSMLNSPCFIALHFILTGTFSVLPHYKFFLQFTMFYYKTLWYLLS